MTLLGWLRDASGLVFVLGLVLLVTSGWALMASYGPTDAEAFSSTLYLRQQAPGGSTVRSVHYHLASAVVVAGFLYLLATFLLDLHRQEKAAWWLGVALYLLVLGLCFTGYLLPMDQNAYWGTVVRLGIIDTVPVVGPLVAQILRGGETFNATTLPRFYALHVAILPLLAALFLVPGLKRMAADHQDVKQPLIRLAAVVGGLVLIYLVASSLGAPLELRADPTDTEYVPRPEWYFLWLFQFGKYVEPVPWVESLLVPVLGLALLLALPLMSRQGLRARLTLALGWIVVWTALTALARYQDRDLPPQPDYEIAMAERAGEAYVDLCQECHGAEGRGDGARSKSFNLDARDFTQAAVWQQTSQADMVRSTRDGKGKDMPSFRRQLNQEEIDAVLAFMRTSFAPAGI